MDRKHESTDTLYWLATNSAITVVTSTRAALPTPNPASLVFTLSPALVLNRDPLDYTQNEDANFCA